MKAARFDPPLPPPAPKTVMPGDAARARLNTPMRAPDGSRCPCRLVITVEGASPALAMLAAQFALVDLSRDRPGAYKLTRLPAGRQPVAKPPGMKR